jgi:hypothetical protein
MSTFASAKIAAWTATSALLIGVGGTAGVASASGAPPPQTRSALGQVRTGTHGAEMPARATEPAGYTIVTQHVDITDGTQGTDTASCPAGTVIWGGGAAFNGGSSAINLGSSYPSDGDTAWTATFNDGAFDSGFTVYAICADKPKSYVIDTESYANPTDTATYATATCPKKTAVLDGGAYSESPELDVNLNSSWPSVGPQKIDYWNVRETNASSSDNTVVVYAVCGKKPKKYAMVAGPSVDNTAGSSTTATVSCAHGMAIGGGGEANSGSLNVNLSDDFPFSDSEFFIAENNGSATDESLEPYVVCAT